MKFSIHPLSFLLISTTLAVTGTFKSLFMPKIIPLEYIPVSTTCRIVLSHGQSASGRNFESGHKFHVVGIPTGRRDELLQLLQVKAVISWDRRTLFYALHEVRVMFICTFDPLALVVQHYVIALQNQLTHWQEMAKVARVVTANSVPRETPEVVSFKLQEKKIGKTKNWEIIIHWFFTIVIGCLPLPGQKGLSRTVWVFCFPFFFF